MPAGYEASRNEAKTTIMAALVSVVIPSYNHGKYIAETIDAALAQTYQPLEVVVVDDGSTDNSAEVLASFGDRIRWFAQKNSGVSRARNWGAGESRGEFIAFCDSDDVWVPQKLEKQIARFDDPEVGLVYCGIQRVDGERVPFSDPVVVGMSGHISTRISQLQIVGVPLISSTSIVSRRCFDVVGGFDPALAYSADWDFWRRAAGNFKVDFVPEVLVMYRVHRSSWTRNVKALSDDMQRAFSKMFSDPATPDEVKKRRRQCYGKLYLAISGSYLEAARLGPAIGYGLRAIAQWPPSAAYVLAAPWRRMKRLVGLERSPLH